MGYITAPHFSRLLRHAWRYGGHIHDLNPRVPTGEEQFENYKIGNESYTNPDDESDVHKMRRVNQKRFVTEERLQQFGRDLRSSITKDVTQSEMESVKSIIVETNRKVIKGELKKFGKQGGEMQQKPKQEPKCYNCSELWHIAREKGRDLTQSYDKSPYTNRNVKRAK